MAIDVLTNPLANAAVLRVEEAARLLTPALLIDRDRVQHNIATTLRLLGGDKGRWRPHIKTAKLAYVMRMLVEAGVHQFKCATSLELSVALGKITAYTYDAAGNMTAMTDARQNVMQYVYDDAGRRTQTIFPDLSTESVAYDALGRQTSKTDQAGKVTQYGYDPLGRLTSVTQFLGVTQLVTSYAYDELGNRISQTDANGHTTLFAYDQMGRRSRRTLPVGMSESYAYDAAGNLAAKTDFNGHTTSYAYDTMNRLLAKTADAFFSTGACAGNACGATQISYTYTATGKRLSMTDLTGATAYTYDTGSDRLAGKTMPASFGNASATWTYDLAGNLTQISGSTGLVVNYTYDALNRLQTVNTSFVAPVTYSYDEVGNLAGVQTDSLTTTSYAYDPLNRLTQIQTVCGATAPGCGAAGTVKASYAYTLGAAGNRLSVAELNGRTVNYGYDDLYRLTQETVAGDPAGKNGQVTYTFDNVGNRLQRNSTLPAVPATGLLNYDANDRTATDPYDANGNLLLSTTGSNVYDFENRLVQAGGVSIVYDGDGNRVQETVAGVTTRYIVGEVNPTGYVQVLAELTGTNLLARGYEWGLQLVAMRTFVPGTFTATTAFFGYDGHGSVRFLSDSTGAITDTYDYDAFGNLISSTGTTQNNYLFAGEQFDPALGVYYNRARYYDQRQGRFWTMDTWEGIAFDPASLHKYLYTSGNPVNGVDPSGYLVEEPLLAQSAGEKIDGDSGAVALRIYQTVFRTTLYAGKELVASTPTLLLRALATLAALGVAASSIVESFTVPQGELPDAAAAHATTKQNGSETPITLFRDVNGTSPSDFKWRGPDKDPDGLSFYESPFKSPVPKSSSVGFKAKYLGSHTDGARGGFSEPELYGIGTVYSPKLGGEGHWSVPIGDQTTGQAYADRFAAAAKRIKQEKINFYSSPNP